MSRSFYEYLGQFSSHLKVFLAINGTANIKKSGNLLLAGAPGCSRVTGPAQCPGIDKVHGATVCSPGPGVTSGEIMVEAMSSVGTAIAIAEQYGSSISSPNSRQSP
jgi:hypothetical protein